MPLKFRTIIPAWNGKTLNNELIQPLPELNLGGFPVLAENNQINDQRK